MKTATLESRHDLPIIVRDAIKRAVALDIIDAVDVAVLAGQCGADGAKWMDALCEAGFANRHTEDGRLNHAMMCQFNDAFQASRR